MMEEEKVQISDEDEGKPILTMEYITGKVFWRLLFPNLLVFIISYEMIFNGYLEIDNMSKIKTLFGYIFFGLMMLAVLFMSLEILLMKNIKLYQDKIEKEWLFFGTKQLLFQNARIRGIQTWFISNKAFLYINKPRWYMFKCCSYDENLISEKDKEEAIKILADISNRDIHEFQKLQVDINLLIKNKG